MTVGTLQFQKLNFFEKQVPDQIDSYRFLNGLTRRTVKSWIKPETPRQIPWTAVK